FFPICYYVFGNIFRGSCPRVRARERLNCGEGLPNGILVLTLEIHFPNNRR
ncbi:hypothetical protein L9F63_022310, partial [Diploptera punctata]